MSYGKLILLLGSDSDGETLAAARALGRRLRADGRDWHWLAAQLDGFSKKRESLPSLDECRTMLDLLVTKNLTRGHHTFVKTVRARLVMFNSLQDWQRRRVGELWRTYS